MHEQPSARDFTALSRSKQRSATRLQAHRALQAKAMNFLAGLFFKRWVQNSCPSTQTEAAPEPATPQTPTIIEPLANSQEPTTIEPMESPKGKIVHERSTPGSKDTPLTPGAKRTIVPPPPPPLVPPPPPDSCWLTREPGLPEWTANVSRVSIL